MNLDINTLLVVTVANIVGLALVSPAVMGARLGAAAQAARWSLVVLALAWISMIASNIKPDSWSERILATLAVAGFATTHWLMYRALDGWLGPRRMQGALTTLTILAPTGYFLGFNDYAMRVGWANFLLAGQLLIVMLACFRPSTPLRGKWRLVLAAGSCVMALLTFGRGYMGAFTDLYPSFLTPHPWNIAAMLMTNVVPVMINFSILGGWHEEAEAALHRQAVTDALTDLYNRRGWLEVAQPLVANANRHDLPLTLLMLDIDFFKKINDSHGHEAGDRALQALSGLLRDHRRGGDVAARIGGEEFCLLLPGSDVSAARRLDQLLRARLPEIASRLGFTLDFSSGLVLRQANESLERMMVRADAAMYAAKEAGRGRLVEA
jgi:diguanylate cyclase (GGDEF)-like protein